MNIDMENNHQGAKKEKKKTSDVKNWSFLFLNCCVLAIGHCGGPLIIRLYFIKGGKRVWLSSWLQTGGWPVMFIPLLISYFHRRFKNGPSQTKLFSMKPHLFTASAFLGLLTGLDDYLYAYGVARLPVSTTALIISTQLGFTAVFAFLLVKQRFTPYSINTIALLTVSAIVLALHTSSDRPAKESDTEYYVGFFMTVGAAGLYGLVLPLVELTYKRANQVMTYSLVIQIQMVISIFATAFCTIGMLINKDFQAIPKEAKLYELGETKYYMVLVANAIIWQFFFLGAIGIIFCSSSLLSGIVIGALLPVTEMLAVIFYHEKFKAEKGLSLALSLWGSISYFYGEFKASKEKNETPEPIVGRSSTPLSQT